MGKANMNGADNDMDNDGYGRARAAMAAPGAVKEVKGRACVSARR